MAFVQHDHVVQAVSTDRTDEPFYEGTFIRDRLRTPWHGLE
jgi:hypothetical protein